MVVSKIIPEIEPEGYGATGNPGAESLKVGARVLEKLGFPPSPKIPSQPNKQPTNQPTNQTNRQTDKQTKETKQTHTTKPNQINPNQTKSNQFKSNKTIPNQIKPIRTKPNRITPFTHHPLWSRRTWRQTGASSWRLPPAWRRPAGGKKNKNNNPGGGGGGCSRREREADISDAPVGVVLGSPRLAPFTREPPFGGFLGKEAGFGWHLF